MPTTVKQRDVAALARIVGLNDGGLLEQIPQIGESMQPAADVLADALATLEAAEVALAKACSDGGIPQGDLFSKDAEQRYKSSALIVARDASIDHDAASRSFAYARDTFKAAFTDALTDPLVLQQIGAIFDRAADRIAELAEMHEAVLTSLSRVEGATNPALRETLRMQGAGGPVVSHDIAQDQPSRVASRAKAKARALAELSDR